MSLRPPGLLRLRPRPQALEGLCCRCSSSTSGGGGGFSFLAPHAILGTPTSIATATATTTTRATRRTFTQYCALRNSSSSSDAANPPPRQSSGGSQPASSRLRNGYFLSNSFKPTVSRRQDASSSIAGTTAEQSTPDLLPHRRRQAERRKAAAAAADAANTPLPTPTGATAAAAATTSDANNSNNVLPQQDASSSLTTAAARQSASSVRRHLSLFLSLSKPRLTVLVVLTSMATYALYPVPAFLSPSIGLDTPSLSPLTLLFLTTGTALCSASANALNMLYEPDTDSKMSRTRNRPLVRKLLSTRAALGFAVTAATCGVGALWFGVNPTVAFLGFANIAIYAGMYTPLKRLSWLNTWVGAVVGGIPPLMGWAAAAGESATGDGGFRELLLTADACGGWLMASLLFAWQFPHFMALSWSIRDEYRLAGHRMLAWVDPARNARVALRYSIAFLPICLGLCLVGVTEWSFAVTSLPVNIWVVREAVRFWRLEGHGGSARGLFWASVWHLPVLMVLALVQKKGMWGRVWRSVVGEPEPDDDDDDDDEWEYEDDDVEGVSQHGVGTTATTTVRMRAEQAARAIVPVDKK
ncbi:heme o synthase [Microdochium nivale]|nr:heme o synthase [Microdochium nivale]